MTKNKIKHFFEKEETQGWLMIFPNTIGLLVFFVFPIIWSIVLAFYQWNGLSPMEFVGVRNIINLFSDRIFLLSLRNTLFYSLLVVPSVLIIVIILGSALSKDDIFGVSKLRTLFFLPLMTMPVAAALVWKWLLNREYGLINKFLNIIHIPSISWLSDPNYILISVALIGIWLAVAYDLIIVIAGIKGISPVYYEVAQIDGASKTRQFFSITLPLLTPSLFFILITQLISCFQVFDSVSILVGLNPSNLIKDAANTVVMNIYENGFIFFKMGYSSAQSLVLFVIVLIITVVQFKLQKKWVHYE